MGDEDFIRQSSDHFVTTERRVPGDPPRRRDEERKKQQPTGLEGCAAFGWDPHPLDHPRRADDDGLFPAQKDAQAFLLDGRLESADDRDTRIP